MKLKIFFLTALLCVSFICSIFFTPKTFASAVKSQKESVLYAELTYVRVLENGVWWMYVYSTGPGGTVLIDRYKIEE